MSKNNKMLKAWRRLEVRANTAKNWIGWEHEVLNSTWEKGVMMPNPRIINRQFHVYGERYWPTWIRTKDGDRFDYLYKMRPIAKLFLEIIME